MTQAESEKATELRAVRNIISDTVRAARAVEQVILQHPGERVIRGAIDVRVCLRCGIMERIYSILGYISPNNAKRIPELSTEQVPEAEALAASIEIALEGKCDDALYLQLAADTRKLMLKILNALNEVE